MTAVFALFLKNNWKPLVWGLAIAAALGALYLKGRSDGTNMSKAAMQNAVFEQLKERSATDEKVRKMSDDDLCRAIGGQLHDNRCE